MELKRKSFFQRAANSAMLCLSPKLIGVKYSRSAETIRNWGDALNEYLVPRISGKNILHVSEYFNTGLTPTLSAIGSVLDGNRVKNLYVWGSGLKSEKSAMPELPRKVFAVRGGLTRKRLKSLNVSCPEVFGDPALILPRYYQPKKAIKKFRIGLVPHYVDKNLSSVKQRLNDPDFTVIDIESGIEEFIDRINECEIIVSSSLHGLIAADAYSIPRIWIKLSGNTVGGDFKFHDYFSTTDYTDVRSIDSQTFFDDSKLKACQVQVQKIADVGKLISAFPFSK